MRHDDFPRNNIFVVGCQRSGTSVVWAGLTAHPELKPKRGYDKDSGYDPKELYYFRNIFAARRQFGSPMYGWDVDRRYLREMIDLTVRFCCENHGAENGRWVSANPADGLYVSDIAETMPESRIIYVLRHPQEVIWSSVHAPWVDSDGPGIEERAATTAKHWKRFAEVALEILDGRFNDQVMLLRHEDIVHHPERTAEALCAHVGVESSPLVAAQLGGPTFNSSFANNAKPAELQRATRKAISVEEKFCQIVRTHVSEEMDQLGYENLLLSRFPQRLDS